MIAPKIGLITHLKADFDALASLCAASLLYPDSIIFKPAGLGDRIRQFAFLYLSHIPFQPLKIEENQLGKLIVLDTNRWDRLGLGKDSQEKLENSENMEIELIDHHKSLGNIRANRSIVRHYGACATIMTQLLIEKNIRISPLYATLLLLGIYEDTGSLNHPTTTPQDLQAASQLLEKGGNLKIVREFTNAITTPDQHRIFQQAIGDLENLSLGGQSVLFACAILEKDVMGLDIIAQKIRTYYPSDALFLLVAMSKSIFIVARGREGGPDIGDIMKNFGGGGHKSSGSACIKGAEPGELADIRGKIVEALAEKSAQLPKAGQIMKSPPIVACGDQSCESVLEMMNNHDISGMPVLLGDEFVGIVERENIEKAFISSLNHAPVSAFMQRKRVFARMDSGLYQLKKALVENEINRLPIMDKEGRIKGILTKRDILIGLDEDLL